MTPGDFKRFVDSLEFNRWRGKTRDRACVPGSGSDCPAGQNKTTSVWIRPEKRAHELNHASLDANGHVIALLTNKKQGTEARYNIPGKADEVYWLVEPNQDGGSRSRFIVVTTGSDTTATPTGPVFDFEQCTHVDNPPEWTRADFRECVPRTVRLFQPDMTESAWISCLAGCCVAKNRLEDPAPADTTRTDSIPNAGTP